MPRAALALALAWQAWDRCRVVFGSLEELAREYVVARNLTSHRRCSAAEVVSALTCWLDDFWTIAKIRACCLDFHAEHEYCWEEGVSLGRCCPCLGAQLGALQAYRVVSESFKDRLVFEPEATQRARGIFMAAERKFLMLRSAEVRSHYRQVFGTWNVLAWNSLLAMHDVHGPTPRGHSNAAIVSQVNVLQRDRVALATAPADGCVINTFTKTCGGTPAPAFRRFLPVHGPPRQGHILDFLGVSTDLAYICSGRGDKWLAGIAPSRLLACLAHKDRTLLRQWPIMDEEYLEWVDVLGAATAAADRGGSFAMAEVGSGPYGIWAMRGAVAFSRLAAGRGSCTLLLVEPETANRSQLRRHVKANMPHGRCAFVDEREYMSNLPDFIRMLDRASVQQVWDLIDVDIQGFEIHMIAGNLEMLAARVRRMHISTHSLEIHITILERLRAAHWTVPAQFPPLSVASFGPYGPFTAMDGHLTAFPPHLAGGLPA